MENNTEVKRENTVQNLIQLSGICKIYNPGENEVRALDHVDLQIHMVQRPHFILTRIVYFADSGELYQILHCIFSFHFCIIFHTHILPCIFRCSAIFIIVLHH